MSTEGEPGLGEERRLLVASLPKGPRSPLTGTPARRPGSVRRTTMLEERWDDFGLPRRVRASGRDLVTGFDGTATVVDAASLSLVTDGTGALTSIAADPPEPRLEGLVGVGVRSGFRSEATALVPDHAERGSVLHQLLDDLPLASLIASYGLTREHPEWNIPRDSVDRLRDVCAGWEDGATMIGALDRTGVFPGPEGPPAPPLTDGADPLAWHDLGERERKTVRRVRRLDLWRADEGALALEVYFRDTHLGLEGPEDVLHELTLTASLEPSELRFTAVAAAAHTLPWPECPGSLASAQRVVGWTADEVAGRVREEFTGTSTCSHLNDLLRSTSAVAALAAELP